MLFLETQIVLSDKELLLGKATFLDLQLSPPDFDKDLPKHLNKDLPEYLKKRINNRLYLSADYLPPHSGPTLWTPLLCFPENSLPSVITCVMVYHSI